MAQTDAFLGGYYRGGYPSHSLPRSGYGNCKKTTSKTATTPEEGGGVHEMVKTSEKRRVNWPKPEDGGPSVYLRSTLRLFVRKIKTTIAKNNNRRAAYPQHAPGIAHKLIIAVFPEPTPPLHANIVFILLLPTKNQSTFDGRAEMLHSDQSTSDTEPSFHRPQPVLKCPKSLQPLPNTPSALG